MIDDDDDIAPPEVLIPADAETVTISRADLERYRNRIWRSARRVFRAKLEGLEAERSTAIAELAKVVITLAQRSFDGAAVAGTNTTAEGMTDE